jgi:hypothetical protein
MLKENRNDVTHAPWNYLQSEDLSQLASEVAVLTSVTGTGSCTAHRQADPRKSVT